MCAKERERRGESFTNHTSKGVILRGKGKLSKRNENVDGSNELKPCGKMEIDTQRVE